MLLPSQIRPEVAAARQELHADLVRRWKTELPQPLQRFYFVATICDPRQKNLRFPGVSPGLRASAQDWFEAEYDSLWAPKPTAARAARAAPPAPAPSHPQHSGASFLAFMANISHMSAGQEQQAEADDSEEVESEAARYLASPDVPMETDIMIWWSMHEAEYPNLSVMARQYLGTPATSASAERLFSVAGRVFDDLRQNLDEKALEERMHVGKDKL